MFTVVRHTVYSLYHPFALVVTLPLARDISQSVQGWGGMFRANLWSRSPPQGAHCSQLGS